MSKGDCSHAIVAALWAAQGDEACDFSGMPTLRIAKRLQQRNAHPSIDHHDRANWNLGEEFARGLGRKADATM
jgi:hypothetical protein